MSKTPTGKQIIAGLKRNAYLKGIFDSPEKRQVMEPFFLIVLPIMLQVIEDLGPEAGFDLVFSTHFREILVATIVNYQKKNIAKVEVDKLLKDLELSVKSEEVNDDD